MAPSALMTGAVLVLSGAPCSGFRGGGYTTRALWRQGHCPARKRPWGGVGAPAAGPAGPRSMQWMSAATSDPVKTGWRSEQDDDIVDDADGDSLGWGSKQEVHDGHVSEIEDHEHLGDTDPGESESPMPPRGPQPVAVPLGAAVEVWQGSKLVLGNYEGRTPGKASVRVRLESGEIVTVDLGQITGVWGLSGVPQRTEEWAQVKHAAQRAVEGLSSKTLSLERFWSQALGHVKRYGAPVDSAHLAAVLFGQPVGREGKRKPQADALEKALKVHAPTPQQRYAAATLLSGDNRHFKRSVAAATDQGEEGGELVVVGQGFKPRDTGVVQTLVVNEFVEAVKEAERQRAEVTQGDWQFKETASVWDAAQWRLLHDLEVVALGGGAEGLTGSTKSALKMLGEKATQDGARSVLLRAGYWTEAQAGVKRAAPTGSVTRGNSINATSPWPSDLLDLAKTALSRANKRRASLKDVALPVRLGRKGPHGRHDYRHDGFRAYCVDPSGTEFGDDALSLDHETGEVLIHIADVQRIINGFPELDDLARQRGEALYLPDGPLHLLPPAALQAVSLSDRYPNECVTVAVKLGAQGQVLSSRLLLTLIPPVFRLRYDEVNSLLSPATSSSRSSASLAAYQPAVLKDLRILAGLAERRREHTGRSFSQGRVVARVKRNRAGELQALEFEKTNAHLMVDEYLALYSEAARRFCWARNVTLPLPPGARARGGDAIRFGTGPLRRYADMLAQRQVAAVLNGKQPLSRTEIVARMKQVNFQRAASQALRGAARSRVLLEAFATFCATKAKASGERHVLVEAVASGTGSEVFVPDAGVSSYVRLPEGWKKDVGGAKIFDIPRDTRLQVRVMSVDPAQGNLQLAVDECEWRRLAALAASAVYETDDEEAEGEQDVWPERGL